MSDLVERHPDNPLLEPRVMVPSQPGLEIVCLLNPGAFRFQGKTWLLVRVAERPVAKPGKVRVALRRDGGVGIQEFASGDPGLDLSDPREIRYQSQTYLSTLSHLRLFESNDGVHFSGRSNFSLVGETAQETYGIEDCRVTCLADGRFLLTYTAVSPSGYGVGLRVTRDWESFEHHGLIIPPANKDCAIFEEKIGGRYACLHRPSGVIVGGHDIWLGWSPDLRHWGDHVCIAHRRTGMWDEERIGAGAPPIRTPRGWLAIYHGADRSHRYCLGALLLDLDDPSKVLARSKEPLMVPEENYERNGFFGNVIFTNGHVVEQGKITLYYGASDTVICQATTTIDKVLHHLLKEAA